MSSKKPFLIGVAGGSGAGKTHFLNAISGLFGPDLVCIVSQDNYYRPAAEQMRDGNGEIDFDHPEGIYDGQFLDDLLRLVSYQPVTRQEYSFNQLGKAGQTLTLQPAPIIMAEGLFLFHFTKIREILDLKIYIEASEEARLARRVKRDHNERGVPHHAIRYQWENHVLPSQKQYLYPYRGMADIVVDNNISLEKGLEAVADRISAELI